MGGKINYRQSWNFVNITRFLPHHFIVYTKKGYNPNRSWNDIRKRDNGPAFAQNRYDEKLEKAYRKWDKK